LGLTLGDGSAGLRLWDDNGDVQAGLSLFKKGPGLQLGSKEMMRMSKGAVVFQDKDSKPRVLLGLDEEGPVFDFSNKEGKAAITVGMRKGRFPEVVVHSPDYSRGLRTVFGDDYFDNAVMAVMNDDTQMEHLRGFTQLRTLFLHGPKVTDAGLRHLEGLTQLRGLLLNGTKVTDTGLEQVKCLPQLQRLILASNPITDAGLRHLEGLSQLKLLWLNVTEVTDAGVRHLETLAPLEDLRLGGTRVTDAGARRLRQASPNCEIRH
jgi:hypothetical protein